MNTFNTLTHKRLCTGLIAMLAWSVSPLVSASTFAEFTGLGLFTDGEVISSVSDLSADGRVIVGTHNRNKAFRYTKSEGVVGLGNFPGFSGDDFNSQANAISADGRVIVGSGSMVHPPDEYPHRFSVNDAFRYTKSEGMVRLSNIPYSFAIVTASAVSADGSVIVGSIDQDFDVDLDPIVGFRYTKSEGVTRLVIPSSIDDVDKEFKSLHPIFVSADGSVIAANLSCDSYCECSHAIRYTSSGGMIVEDMAYIYAVSADGSVIVGSKSTIRGQQETVRYTSSEDTVALEDISRATAISADGSVIVGSSNGKAIRYTDSEGVVKLGDLFGEDFDSVALLVSADGNVIVGTGESDNGEETFVWDAGSDAMKSLEDELIADGLDLSEWSDLIATAISDDGSTIVGSGIHNGNKEAFVAQSVVPVPLPASVWLMSTALLGLLGFQRTHAARHGKRSEGG